MPDPTPGVNDRGLHAEAAARLLPHIDSFVKWELLRFLSDNPDTAATVEDLARYLGRDEVELKHAARALAGAGLFIQIHESSICSYALTTDETVRRLIRHLVNGFIGNRLVRLAISSHILSASRQAVKLEFAT